MKRLNKVAMLLAKYDRDDIYVALCMAIYSETSNYLHCGALKASSPKSGLVTGIGSCRISATPDVVIHRKLASAEVDDLRLLHTLDNSAKI